MPTAAQNTYPSAKLEPFYDAKQSAMTNVNLPASVTYARGTILGELTATPGTYKAYTTGAVDGSQNASAILTYDCSSDAAGNITLATAGTAGGEFGQTQNSVPAYFAGTFQTADLVQSGPGAIDAGAVTKLGRLISGTITAGVLRMG